MSTFLNPQFFNCSDMISLRRDDAGFYLSFGLIQNHYNFVIEIKATNHATDND